jgi:hypothetical protein
METIKASVVAIMGVSGLVGVWMLAIAASAYSQSPEHRAAFWATRAAVIDGRMCPQYAWPGIVAVVQGRSRVQR